MNYLNYLNYLGMMLMKLVIKTLFLGLTICKWLCYAERYGSKGESGMGRDNIK